MESERHILIQLDTEQLDWQVNIFLDQEELFNGLIPGNWISFGYFMSNVTKVLQSMKREGNFELVWQNSRTQRA
jgi:hypothetical protein